jgi:hypothetical protein
MADETLRTMMSGGPADAVDTPPSTSERRAGDDQPVSESDALTIVKAITEYEREADAARRTRLQKNKRNMRAYLGEADWSHKQKGQSKEFLPKTPMAIEQFSAFVKRALVAYGDWFQVELPSGDPLTPEAIVKMLRYKLERVGSQDEPFATIVSDGVKVGALNSLTIFKVHGRMVTAPQYRVERGLEFGMVNGQPGPIVRERLGRADVTSWQLLVDLVRPEDYYCDPTGRGLYEIHKVERDLADVVAWAEAGVYDRAAVARITEDFAKSEDEAERARVRGQDPATPPSFRRRVVISEFYGTILNAKGEAVHRDVLCAIANDKYVIRKPMPLIEAFWHGESPIIAFPLIRVPFSTLHKALADHMTDLNTSLNELFNLMLDGGMSSVWGIKQLHTDWLEDPRQVSDGIPQGSTLQVNSQCPPGAKVLERVDSGTVPQDAMAMFQMTDHEFLSASLSNDLKMGHLPAKAVKATEVVEASAASAATVDGLVQDMEGGIQEVLRKAWLTLLQHADDLAADDVVAAIGPRAALALARMSPAERFRRYATGCKFRVYGLSAVLARQRDFQKIAALLGLISSNPLLLQAFLKKYSIDKTLSSILKTLNISPDMLQADEAELADLPQRLADLPKYMAILGVKQTGGDGTPGVTAQTVGDASLPSQINQQQSNPLVSLGI